MVRKSFLLSEKVWIQLLEISPMVQVSKKYAVLCHQNAHEADMRRRYAVKKQACAKRAQTCAKTGIYAS